MAFPRTPRFPSSFAPKEGLLGQAAVEGRPFIIRDVPDGYLTVGSALGQDKPRHLVISPASADGAVNTVVELGFINPVSDDFLALLDQASESIGVAVRSANYRAELQNLLEETQRQSEELQVQSEELRVSNEELEEQSRALKESQARLEQQQAELEQTNAQLEEQAAAIGNPARRSGADHRRGAAEGAGAGTGEPVQIRFPGQHVARAADAAQFAR